MSRTLGHKILKGLLWTLAGIVIIVIAIPCLLYIPAIQNVVKNVVIEKVNASGDMKIDVERILLRFPLKLSAEGVDIMEAPGDTMVTASRIDVDVRFMPLLKGEISISGATADSVFYQMGNADSLMWIRARVNRAELDASMVALKQGKIDVDRAMVDGADIYLRMLVDTTATPVDTAQSTPWIVKARDLELRNVTYRMSMMPTIDSLGTTIASARLSDGTVDMTRRVIHAASLSVDSVEASYIYPSAEWLSKHPYPVAPVDSLPTPADKQWTVTADHLSLTGRRATYAERGALPLPGFDPSYISATDITIEVDSFYNRATSITVPIKRIAATERCGLQMTLTGRFSMFNGLMQATGMELSTLFSRVSLDASMGIGDLTTDPTVPITLRSRGNIAMTDVRSAFPALSPFINNLPAGDLEFNTDIDGTSSALNIYTLSARLPRLLTVDATGQITDYLNPDAICGDISINGSMQNLNRLKPTVLEARLAKMVNLPDMTIDGDISYRPNIVSGNIDARTGNGQLALDLDWNGNVEGYRVNANLNDFPVDHFMPTLGVGRVTATLDADGRGYNPLKAGARADIHAVVDNVTYNKTLYRDITLDATLAEGIADGNLTSHNPGADLSANFNARLDRDNYAITLDGDIRDLNLQTLALTDTVNNGSLSLRANGNYNPVTSAFDADIAVDNLKWQMPGMTVNTPSVTASALSSDSVLKADITNGDMRAQLSGHCSIDSFLTRVMRASDIAMKQVDNRYIDVRAINDALPDMTLTFDAGRDNIIADYLKASSDITFNNASMTMTSDSILKLNGEVLGLIAGSTRTDTIKVDAIQHGAYLVYNIYMNNRPGTFDAFAYVGLNGYIAHDRMSAILRQNNIKGEKGFQLGFRANVSDSIATLKLVPYSPTIAYQQWTVNKDNFISFNFVDKHLDANLSLTNDRSAVRVFTNHVEGDSTHSQEDITLQLSDIKLQDWLSISPFAPPVKGVLGADMKFRWDSHDITGNGTIGLTDLYYGRERVGTFDLGVDIARNTSGVLRADVALMVDSVKTITAQGVLNDSTLSTPFLLDFKMIHFPLKVVNPFLPPGMAKLQGTLNGVMDITGDMTAPVFNGYLDFDSTVVNVTMLGTPLKFAETRIPVDSNIVTFDNFAITAFNDNPLTINGKVDARHINDIGIDLAMSARNMMIVNAKRARGGSDAYGKAYIDLDATARGDMSMLAVDASLALLEGTNVTYVIPDATTTLTSRSTGDMVKFVQFNDTTQVAVSDSVPTNSMSLYLNAEVDIREGSTVNVDLSTDGKNKVQIQSAGSLTYSLNPMNDGRLTGRLNINKGFVRYTPPFMSEKLFNFIEGSYVSFNGEMMNPILNIKAVDEMKANVTQEGQNSRLVNFDVSLAVTGTLDDMNVAFDLSTNDDITVQNELTSMSAEQRANQAMNLLLYNVYVGAGTKATANLNGNPLYSFLESQLNSWMANNVRGVDISFGIDQYDKTLDGSTSTTTSYSYRVSKTLFNDRFKIVVGGNYSTDADADENFSQNLINDISFEYMLNRSGSMYVRIFRHVGYESILEGEVTQTGVGFVLKRKISTLLDLFRRQPKPEPAQAPTLPWLPVATPTPTQVSTPSKDNQDENR